MEGQDEEGKDSSALVEVREPPCVCHSRDALQFVLDFDGRGIRVKRNLAYEVLW